MSGLSTVDSVWSVPVDDYSLQRGENWNTDYVVNGFEPQYFWGDRLANFLVTTDSQPIRNYDKILALLLRNQDILTTVTIPVNGKDRYDLVSKAADISYVSRYIDGNIVSVSTTSVCTLTGPVSQKIGLYDARFIINNLGGKLVCQITLKATRVSYIRAFTISGTTITLLDPITGNTSGITGLTAGDRFELLNAYDVLVEGLEETTGYPTKGYVKKHVVPTENAYVIFNKYDQPFQTNSNEKVAISYRALENYNQAFVYDDSIRHYGLYTYSNELNFTVTQDSIDYIQSTLAVYSEPQITVEFETYRPTKPKKGWIIEFNVTGVVVGRYIITSVNETYISPKGQKVGHGVKIWRVTAQNYVDTLPSLIAGLKRKNDLSKAKLANNIIQKSFFTFNLNFSFVDNPVQIYVCENLVASGINEHGFTASCDTVPGASSYIYRISTHSDFRDAPTGFHYPDGVTSPTVTISSSYIEADTLYYFQFAAIINRVATDWSDTLEVTTDVLTDTRLEYLFTSGATDSSGNGYNGTLVGTDVSISGGRFIANSVFGGDYLSVPPAALNVGTGSFEIETKINLYSGYAGGYFRYIFSHFTTGNPTTNNPDAFAWINDSGQTFNLLLYNINYLTEQTLTWNISMSAGVDYIYKVVRTGDDYELFVDGVSLGIQTITNDKLIVSFNGSYNANNFKLGSGPSQPGGLLGTMDYFTIKEIL